MNDTVGATVFWRGGWRGRGNFRGSSRHGLGHQQREPQQQFFCEICKVTCGGDQSYKKHLEGRPHKNKEAMSKGESVQTLPRNKVTFKCDVCSVMCSGKDTYDAHVKGVKHQKTIALLKKLGHPLPATEPTLIPPKNPSASVLTATVGDSASANKIVGVCGTKFVGGPKLNTTGIESIEEATEQPVLAESNIDLIGQEFIEELRGTNGKPFYNCKLCDCKLTDPNEKVSHLKGRRHKLQYKNKINPELKVEFKTMNSAWKKRGLRENCFYPPQVYHQPMVVNSIPQCRPIPLRGQCVESNDDRHVVVKNDIIHLTKVEMDAVEKLVTMTERTLKNISDKFAEEDRAAMNTASTESTENKIPSAEPERLLKGVMRVGLLAKNLLLNFDSEVNLVVLCSKIPTESLVQRVCELFPSNTEKEESESLKLIQNIPEACLVVNFADVPIACRITFTSVLVRKIATVSVTEFDSGTPNLAIERPVDALQVKPCLDALDELNHVKYYQIKCASLHSMNIALRIVRDISRRLKTWAPLSEWAMELLTERALSSIQVSLGPGDAIRRVFEVIAGGILFKGASSLLDPCQKEPTNVMGNLSEQESENITSSAQHALRMISFNQIYKILAIDRLPDKKLLGTFHEAAMGRKRACELGQFSSADETLDLKKEKIEEPAANP